MNILTGSLQIYYKVPLHLSVKVVRSAYNVDGFIVKFQQYSEFLMHDYM